MASFAGCAPFDSAQGDTGLAQNDTGLAQGDTGLALSLTNARRAVPTVRRSGRSSWVRAIAKNAELLYASDEGRGEVDIYLYARPNKELVGRLAGFDIPSGECSDGAGNVYVTDFIAADVLEFARGGSTPKKTLSVKGEPIGCSIDPTTGNLAVSAFEGAERRTGSGGVWIFPNAKGKPTLYADAELQEYWSPGYDNKGNLFVEGEKPNSPTLDELPRGGGSFEEIALSGATITSPGGVMWDGAYVAAGDQEYQGGLSTAIYRVRISGSTGNVVRTTQLTDACNASGATDVVQPWVEGTEVVGGDISCSLRFDYWNYARGGAPTKSIHANIAPEFGSGQTISR
ncbi:MAG: hypothetical protein WAK16_00205 [Candidatus Cybelea sp.]